MTESWNWLVIILVVGNIAACYWLIRWTAKQGDDNRAPEDTLDHVWDGDLRERNQPLPRWWLMLFYATILFGVAYVVLYPGLGNFAGALNWSQAGQHAAEIDAVESRYAELYAGLAGHDWDTMTADTEAMAIGANLFGAYCSTCHGSDGGGAPGFPSLKDTDWLYGGDFEAIQTSIANGRNGMMPPMGAALGEQGVLEVLNHVKSLSGLDHDADLAAAGQARWAICAACHGPEGQGNPALGAPDLSNNVWLHGASDETLTQTIRDGRNSAMPAHKDQLSADKIRLLSGYVGTLGDELQQAK
jgi:cytochrome c oxidase cbb3-type subunit 3